MRTTATLLAGLLLALPVAARPNAEFITRDDVERDLDKFVALARQVRSRKLDRAELIRHYHDRAGKGATKREQARNSFMYGLVLERVVGDVKEARREYQRAIEFYPAFPTALVALARLAAIARDTKEAERQVRKALQIEPRSVEAINLQAQLYAIKGNHARAIELFNRSVGIDLTVEACNGLAASYMELHRRSFDPEEKERLGRRAVAAADGWITLQPENPQAYLFRAQVQQDQGRIDEAIDGLEDVYEREGLDEERRLRLLYRLRQLYQMTMNVEGVKETLKRLLKHDLPADQRGQVRQRLAEVEERGKAAFTVWQIEWLLDLLQNKGVPVAQRRRAMRQLLDALPEYLATPEVADLRKEIVNRCFRVMVNAPRELRIDFMKFLRTELPNPQLIRILVHFVYPLGKTDVMREEAVRTLGMVSGEAAIPALLYCLQDDSGRVLREVDKQLSRLAEMRSPTGGGIEPLRKEETVRCRRFWNAWVRSEEGSDSLVSAFARLVVLVKRDPTYTRSLRAAPMVDHAANLLEDNDLRWPAWKAAYDFLVGYWGKDFRPVERRGKPVEEFEREQVVAELKAFLRTPTDAAPPPQDPGGDDGEKKE